MTPVKEFNPYLASEDIPEPVTVTIAKFFDMDKWGGKLLVYFIETEKPLVLNETNTKFLKSLNDDAAFLWKGDCILKQVVLYAEKLKKPCFGKEYGLRLKKV